MKRLSMRRSIVVSKDELRNLEEKREEKRKRFQWLAKFLSRRPNKKSLEDKGILGKDKLIISSIILKFNSK